jgi:hypothetical protein
MSDTASSTPSGDSEVDEHTHHWLIGDQEGPSSPAVCKECGERREFSNSFTRRKSMWASRAQSAQRDDSTGSETGVDHD